MRKVLFITSRNIVRTCGELRLIKNRAEALYHEFGIQSDFLIITSTNYRYLEEKFSYNAKIKILNYSVKNPMKLVFIINNLSKIVESTFQMDEYFGIIISGLFIPFSLKKVREKWKNMSIFMDIHGAYEDVYNSVSTKNPFKKSLFYGVYELSKKCEPLYYKYVDGFFVVSSYLKEYIEKIGYCKNQGRKEFFIVPCALQGTPICDEEYISNRIKARNKYGFSDTDIVLVYSGGNSPWQRFDKSLEFYLKCQLKNKNIRFLVLSQNIEDIKDQYGEIEGVIYDSLKPQDVYSALCGGDIGLMIRDHSVTNACAYPNKFLEYVNGRLLVVANDSVVEIQRHIEKYHVGIVIDGEHDYQITAEMLEVLRKKYRGFELLNETGFPVTLRGYVEFNENSIY